MLVSMLLPIHIVAGGLAIVLGAFTLSVRKGGNLHRRGGMLFVSAMLVMGIRASILGLRNGITDGNVMAGLLAAYFVVGNLGGWISDSMIAAGRSVTFVRKTMQIAALVGSGTFLLLVRTAP